MAIKAYSLAKDGNKKLSANFAVKEFRCKDGTDPIFIDDVLVKLLQNIRNHFGKAVTITSAYRTAAHNGQGRNVQSALLRYGGRYSDSGRGRGNARDLRRNAAEKHRRHRTLPGKNWSSCWLGTHRHPCGKEPLGGLRVGGKQNGEHSESFSDGIP